LTKGGYFFVRQGVRKENSLSYLNWRSTQYYGKKSHFRVKACSDFIGGFI